MATLTVSRRPSIQAAINAASSGDTIDVQAGTYNDQFLTIEHLVDAAGCWWGGGA